MHNALAFYDRWRGTLDRASLHTVATALRSGLAHDACGPARDWLTIHHDARLLAVVAAFDQQRIQERAALAEIINLVPDLFMQAA